MYNLCNSCQHENKCKYKNEMIELKKLESIYPFAQIRSEEAHV